MLDPSDQSKIGQQIKIDGNAYTILVTNNNSVWKVLLTNLIEIWVEVLTEESIAQRCQELNPLLSIEEFDYTATVFSLLYDITNHVAQTSLQEIKLKTIVEGGVFKFSIKLTKGTPQELWENVTKPLCLSSIELTRRHKILIDLVKRKDEEIAEYKAEGATLIRKNIETKAFNEDQFKMHTPASDTVACVNAFQSVIEFYNSIDFAQSGVKSESETPSPRKRSTGKTKQDIFDDDSPPANHKSCPSQKSNVKHDSSESTPQSNEKTPIVNRSKKFKRSPRNIIV